jgi:hypothetical protein
MENATAVEGQNEAPKIKSKENNTTLPETSSPEENEGADEELSQGAFQTAALMFALCVRIRLPFPY